MKKFEFTLQTVHNVREIRREREGLVLAKLQAEAEKAALRVAHIESMRNEAIENYTNRLSCGGQMNATEMELNSNHFASLNNLQREAEKVLAEKKRECLLQAAMVAAAMREVKITDQLRETQKERHDSEFARLEQSSIDEIVSTNFARRIQKL